MDSIPDKPKNFRSPERWNSVTVPERVSERAITNIDIQADGCWISRYSTSTHGYAQIGWAVPAAERRAGKTSKNEMVLAHRAAWTHVNGQVPLGMTLDHLCKERRCVNPEHLRVLPNYENARRTSGRDWPMGYCANGHDSTHLVKTTRAANAKGFALICGTCQRARQREWTARNPEKVKASSRAYNAKRRPKPISDEGATA